MSQVYSTLEVPDVQAQTSLHICSNLAVGTTLLTPYWQKRVATLKQEAVPFQILHDSSQPTLLLDVEQHPRLSALLDPGSDTFELWPTWCTFFTTDHELSDTFLLLSLSNRESYWLVLHFEHSQHLAFLQQVEEAKQLQLAVEPNRLRCTVPFADPELTLHLDTIERVQSSEVRRSYL